MALSRYYGTIALVMLIGGLVGTVIGAAFGYLGREDGWWGVGLLLGLMYGTLAGFARADRE